MTSTSTSSPTLKLSGQTSARVNKNNSFDRSETFARNLMNSPTKEPKTWNTVFLIHDDVHIRDALGIQF